MPHADMSGSMGLAVGSSRTSGATLMGPEVTKSTQPSLVDGLKGIGQVIHLGALLPHKDRWMKSHSQRLKR